MNKTTVLYEFREVILTEDRQAEKIVIPLYERQFRVLETVYNKDGISQRPVSNWQPECYIHDAMTYFRSKFATNEFISYSYEERYVPVDKYL